MGAFISVLPVVGGGGNAPMQQLPVGASADIDGAVSPSAPLSTLARGWRAMVAPFEKRSDWRAGWQVAATFGPLVVLLVAMYLALGWSYWATLLLALPTGAFLVRTFLLMHDCAHGSLFTSRRANDVLGFVAGVLTLTPYEHWRKTHVLHHATAGDLDRRGSGDVVTLTVNEYRAESRAGRFRYRLYRNPVVMLVLGPLHLALNQRRMPDDARVTPKERSSVRMTNVAIVGGLAAACLWLGPAAVAMIYLPSFFVAGAAGIFLFYVQHQFEGTYWEEHGDWEYSDAALHGSSYLRLPRVLEWMTCSIGLHHVHHLSPRVPSYRLHDCHASNPALQEVTVVTLREGMKAFSLKLWDEESKRLVTYREARTML